VWWLYVVVIALAFLLFGLDLLPVFAVSFIATCMFKFAGLEIHGLFWLITAGLLIVIVAVRLSIDMIIARVLRTLDKFSNFFWLKK